MAKKHKTKSLDEMLETIRPYVKEPRPPAEPEHREWRLSNSADQFVVEKSNKTSRSTRHRG